MQKKILIVEDTDDVREMYSFALQTKHLVEEAIDGEEALRKITDPQASFDLILLDVMLPKLDGISILRKIKAPESPSKNIPVFLFTNLGMEEVVHEATSLGAVKCFVKANILPENILQEIDQYFLNPTAYSQAATASIPTQASTSQTSPTTQQPNPTPPPSPAPMTNDPIQVNPDDLLNLDEL